MQSLSAGLLVMRLQLCTDACQWASTDGGEADGTQRQELAGTRQPHSLSATAFGNDPRRTTASASHDHCCSNRKRRSFCQPGLRPHHWYGRWGQVRAAEVVRGRRACASDSNRECYKMRTRIN